MMLARANAIASPPKENHPEAMVLDKSRCFGQVCPGSVPWLCALPVCPGCVPWLCALAVCPGCGPWLCALAVCPGCEPWLCACMCVHSRAPRRAAPRRPA
eukprot:5709015-Lingulodinium_polyedra.AAC.1